MNLTQNRLGINDYTGTLKGMLSNALFTNTEIVNGNFKEMMPGIIDVRTYR